MSGALSVVHALDAAGAAAAGSAAPGLVDARDISVDFYLDGVRQRVLDDITLSVPKGSFVSLIGPSGCGKSTLLKVLAGLIAPTEGQVSVDGIAPHEAAKRRIIGLAFQDPTLLPWKNAIENAAFLLMTADDAISQSRRRGARRRHAEARGSRWSRAQDALAAFGRHAPARGYCARARARSAGAADGRAVRRARRHHPRRDEPLPARNLATHRKDHRAGDALHRRGHLPLGRSSCDGRRSGAHP